MAARRNRQLREGIYYIEKLRREIQDPIRFGMEDLQEKFLRNEFTLEDFYEQLQQMKKMGSMKDLLSMVPGLPADLPLDEVENKLNQWQWMDSALAYRNLFEELKTVQPHALTAH